MSDMDGRRTDVMDGPSQWLTLSEASQALGKTERTLRRYASGEIRTPAGLELKTEDGRVLFRVTDGEGRKPDTDGRVRHSVTSREPLLVELEATKSLLHEKEIVIAGLEAKVKGKEELIDRLETDLSHSQQSIEHMEILLSNLQKALPLPASAGETVEAEVQVTPEPTGSKTELETGPPRRLLWLWILLSVLGLAGGFGYLAWYTGWWMP